MADERVGNYGEVETKRSLAAGGGSIRLLGDLKATTAVTTGTDPEEKVCVAGYKTVKVVGKFSSVTANCVLEIHAMTMDGSTRLAPTGDTDTQVQITAAGQFECRAALEGEQYIEIEVQAAAGKACTVDWLEVSGTLN